MSKFIIRRAKAEDGAALCAIYAPYITDTTITFEYEVPTDAAFSDRIRETAAQFPYLVCERDGEIIGYAYAHRIRERAAYDWDAELSVYLKQGTHGRGIGTVRQYFSKQLADDAARLPHRAARDAGPSPSLQLRDHAEPEKRRHAAQARL